ncbi:N-acetyltransferase [Streptomyces sp. NPDC087843]|uniref:N-acetyltransferase n=1 Tax=Streptomyces sp. NPDC087843 TaxID=3365804 RepID=UPI00382ECC1C
MTWLPADFAHPLRVELPGGHHLRPITAADAAMDYPVVMGSRERLWSQFGEAWGWPAETMTYEANQKDLERHEAEIAAHESFNYVLLDETGTVESGCVYIDPPEKAGADAEISWWVTDDRAGTDLERELDSLVPRWIAADWPFARPRFIGRDLSWRAWLALPDARA